MTESEEAAYIAGERAALRRIMRECARSIGGDDPEARAAHLLIERSETSDALRRVIQDHGGDATYPANLHLVDVVRRLEGML